MSKPRGKGWFYLGSVGVDAGMLMVTDPCYIRSWSDDEPMGHEVMKHVSTGKKYRFDSYGRGPDEYGAIRIGSYEDIVPGTEKTFNQLLASGEVVRIPWDLPFDYSYRGACLATTGENSGGELHNSIGASLGVVFPSGYGDGIYEVWGRKNEDDRVVEVRIFMD